ncbi:MAG: glycosyltransferase family A protein [Planctomycetota bacterium]
MSAPGTLAAIVWTAESTTALLEKTLEPLALGACRPDEIVVLAAALTEPTAELVAAYSRRHLGLLPPKRDEGSRSLEAFDKAIPLGLEMARADWVLILAAGEVVRPDALARALVLAREHPSAGAVLARAATFDPAGALASHCRGIPGRADAGFETGARFRELTLRGEADPLDHVVPGAALLRRDALLALGGVRPALGTLGLPVAVWTLAALHGAACLPEPLVDEQGPVRDIERALIEDLGSLVEPVRHLDALERHVPREDARRFQERLRERIRANARATLAAACDTLEGATRILAAGDEAALADRALVRLLELTVGLERGLLRPPPGETNA